MDDDVAGLLNWSSRTLSCAGSPLYTSQYFPQIAALRESFLARAIHIEKLATGSSDPYQQSIHFGFMIDLGQRFEFRDTGYLLVRVQ